MAFLARNAGLSWSRGTSRSFCYQKLNFSNATVAYKIMMPSDKLALQLSTSTEAFQVELESSHSLADLQSSLVERGTCK